MSKDLPYRVILHARRGNSGAGDDAGIIEELYDISLKKGHEDYL
jgi:hypothetical protein